MSPRPFPALQWLGALALVLAGGAAQATGYHLVLDKDAAHPVGLTVTHQGKRTHYKVAPGVPVPVAAGYHLAFRFEDRLGPGRTSQEVTFHLYQHGAAEPVSQFHYYCGMPPRMRVMTYATSGLPAYKAFQGETKEDDTRLVWRGGMLEWHQVPPPYNVPAVESKEPAPAAPSSPTTMAVP